MSFPHDLRLRVENLALGRGGRRLAAGLDFALGSGEALVVTGPNGAGKSTLLRVLAGLLAADSGRFSLTGAGSDDMQIATHYLGHADALKGSLSVAENLAFWSRMLGADASGPTPAQALEAVALSHAHDLPVSYLSAGQRRRAAIARLIVAPRPLWLLDEPTTALDVASQQRFAGLMGAHLAAGGIVIAATHADLGLVNARELQLGAAR